MSYIQQRLVDIVKKKDLQRLESFCIRVGSYRAVMRIAEKAGIDSGEIEELLGEIS